MSAAPLLLLTWKLRACVTPRRLHRSTYVVLLFAAALLFLANVPGQVVLVPVNDPAAPWWVTSPPFDALCVHGWPLVYWRTDPKSLFHDSKRQPTAHDVVWSSAAQTVDFSYGALSLDIVVAVGSLAVTLLLYERWRRRRHNAWQFRMIDLAAAVLVAAIISAWAAQRIHRNRADTATLSTISDYADPVWQPGGASFARALFAEPFDAQWGNFGQLVGWQFDPQFGGPWRRFDRLAGLAYRWPRFAWTPSRSSLAPSAWTMTDYVASLAAAASFPDLEFVSLPRLTHIEWRYLSRCSRLRVVDPGKSVQLDEVDSLPVLAKVEALNMIGATVQRGGLAFLRRLPRLQQLGLGGESQEFDIRHVAGLRELRMLKLGVSFAGEVVMLDTFAQLPRLEALQLAGKRVDDRWVARISRLQSLQELKLYVTSISDHGAAELQRLLPKCRIVVYPKP